MIIRGPRGRQEPQRGRGLRRLWVPQPRALCPGLPGPSPARQGAPCGPRLSLQPQAPLRSSRGSRPASPYPNFPANLSTVAQRVDTRRDAEGVSVVGQAPASRGPWPPRGHKSLPLPEAAPAPPPSCLHLLLPPGGPSLDAATCQLGAGSAVPNDVSTWKTGKALTSWLPWKDG